MNKISWKSRNRLVGIRWRRSSNCGEIKKHKIWVMCCAGLRILTMSTLCVHIPTLSQKEFIIWEWIIEVNVFFFISRKGSNNDTTLNTMMLCMGTWSSVYLLFFKVKYLLFYSLGTFKTEVFWKNRSRYMVGQQTLKSEI